MEDNPAHDVCPDAVTTLDSKPVLSLDTVLEVLANQRRRFALYSLIDSAEGVITMEALIEDVATLEAAHADVALTRDRYVSVAADLVHWHVEVLAEVGLVEYDERSRTIRYQYQSLLETWVKRTRHDELA